ncbi:MAG: hypothetical protein M3483_04880 [Gemmatimonadota bacterium]|nr:hypothetical protein [Gemmatimonadota bacterium]
MSPGTRILVSIRRNVSQAMHESYDDMWGRLHAAVITRGGHAWRFRAVEVEELYLEFLEFGAEGDLRADPGVVEAIAELHAAFGDPYPIPRTLEEWTEIPLRTERQ